MRENQGCSAFKCAAKVSALFSRETVAPVQYPENGSLLARGEILGIEYAEGKDSQGKNNGC